MSKKITLDGAEYDLEKLSEQGKLQLASLQFATDRVKELVNMQSLLLRAKNSYVGSLKKEVLAKKSGFQFGDD